MSTASVAISIDLRDRSYPVHIGAGELSRLGERLAADHLGPKALLATNPIIAKHYGSMICGNLVAAGLDPVLVEVPAGERAKKLATVEQVCNEAIAAGLDRGSVVIALGGGVIGDVVGFVAASLYRGVDLVQVPTTLVAMVDSSVGGKTGVNTKLGKNLIGAFWQPSLVVADLDTLRSLPPRELRCGMAEVIKHGCIVDAAMFERLEATFVHGTARGPFKLTRGVGMDDELVTWCVQRSCELKGAVVAADEHEADQRAWLNYGHTFGHALEAVGGYGRLHHGEAVAVGMVLAARLGVLRGDLSRADADRIVRLLEAVGLPTTVPRGMVMDAVFEAMYRDKKVRAGRLRLTLLKRLGEAMVCDGTPPDQIRDLLHAAGREAEHEA